MYTLYRHTLYRLANGHLMSQTFNARKKKASEARSNHTGVGVGRQTKRAQRCPRPLPCQVSRFVLASSSLCILSVRLTIE